MSVLNLTTATNTPSISQVLTKRTEGEIWYVPPFGHQMPSVQVRVTYSVQYLHTPKRNKEPEGEGVGDIPTLIFISALDVGKWSVSRPGRFTSPPY